MHKRVSDKEPQECLDGNNGISNKIKQCLQNLWHP